MAMLYPPGWSGGLAHEPEWFWHALTDDQHHIYLFFPLETDRDHIVIDLPHVGTPVSGNVVDFMGINTE